MKKQSAFIIKKVKKTGQRDAHSGSWKVAYADIVTAMMAFFLLLWIITMVPPQKKTRVAAYFKYFSIHSESGLSFMEHSSEIFNESGKATRKALRTGSMTEVEKELKEGIMSNLDDARDQVMVDTVDVGVRIQIVDKDGSLMFDKGSNKITPKAREIMGIISDNIKYLPNRIAIEGHTDSLQYAGSNYSNWELSTERASSARRELEANGVQPHRIERVSGFADTIPLIADDPADARNRRISIILKVPYADETQTAIAQRKTDAESGFVNNDEFTDEGSRMVNKFEENLSMIKNGMSAAETENKENIAHTSAPVPDVDGDEKDKHMKEDGKGPIVIKELSNPVISKDVLFK